MRVTVNNDNNVSRSSNQQHQNYQQSNHVSNILPSTIYSENNFYCSICDQHCSQKQLSYIVIKIPACVSCSTKKIAIIDDDHFKNNEHDYKTMTENIILSNDYSEEKVELRRSASPNNLSTTETLKISHQHDVDKTISNVLNNSVDNENIIVKDNSKINNLVSADSNILKFDENMKVEIDTSSKATMKNK